jgi:hypothetical protein
MHMEIAAKSGLAQQTFKTLNFKLWTTLNFKL